MRKVDGIERSVPAAQTVDCAASVAESLGVTRVADITGLDRIGIPVYSAIVPDSADNLSVYNGKGMRAIDAKAGALMEAIERQTALKARLPMIEESYAHLSENACAIDPRRINYKLAANYSEDRVYSWCRGVEIRSGRECWVPAKLAGFNWFDVPHAATFVMTDTNGLASGNTREEAICHALCELAERDAWTFAEIGAHHMPRERRALALGLDAKDGPDDLEIFPCVELDGEDEVVAKFWDADLFPVVRDITSEMGVPTFFASLCDESITGHPMAHCGLGTHPNAVVAFRRALVEVAQSRCVDIQAVREDILPPDAVCEHFTPHTRRVGVINRASWCFGSSKTMRKLCDVLSYGFGAIEDDLEFLLNRFAACGLEEIVVVDFTPDADTYSVVRVIVPGIENWALDHGRLGPRALRFWKQNV